MIQPPLVAVAHIHVFDEAGNHAAALESAHQIQQGVIVVAPLDDHIDLDRHEPRRNRRVDSLQHTRDAIAAAVHFLEHLIVEGVQTHCDAAQAGSLQLYGVLGQEPGIGGQGDILDAGNGRQHLHENGQIPAQQGFTAGEADLFGAAAGEESGQPLDLLESQYVRFR